MSKPLLKVSNHDLHNTNSHYFHVLLNPTFKKLYLLKLYYSHQINVRIVIKNKIESKFIYL